MLPAVLLTIPLLDPTVLDPALGSLRVGAPYWESARYERALALAQADGLIVRTADGRLSAV